MARRFTNQEREAIREKLIQEGKILFGKFGLKKTSIAQLTSQAGISPASFYLFFNSKEELYFYIFKEETSKIQNELLSQLMSDPNFTIKHLLLTVKNQIQNDPFLMQLFSSDNLNQMLSSRSDQEINQHVSKDYEQFVPVITHLQKQEKIINKDPKVLTTIIQLFISSYEHRDKFDADVFDQAMELLAEWISQGLTKSSE